MVNPLMPIKTPRKYTIDEFQSLSPVNTTGNTTGIVHSIPVFPVEMTGTFINSVFLND